MTYDTELWYDDDGLIAPPAIEIRMPRSNKGDLIATISRTRAMQDLHELTLAISQHDEWLKMAGTNPNMKDDLDISNDPRLRAVHAALLAYTAVLTPSADPKDYIKDLLNDLVYYHYQGGIDNQGGGDMTTPVTELLDAATKHHYQLYDQDPEHNQMYVTTAYDLASEGVHFFDHSFYRNCIRQPKLYTHGVHYNGTQVFLIAMGERKDYRLYLDPENAEDHVEVNAEEMVTLHNPDGDGAFPTLNDPDPNDLPDDYINWSEGTEPDPQDPPETP